MPASGATPSWDVLIAGCGLPRLEARVLAQTAGGCTREWLIAHGDEAPPEDAARRFADLAARRVRGEPVAYLTGEREFHGHRFLVGPSVLIPRPDTELLVDWAIKHAARGARVLELGTGSGAIAVSLAHARPDLTIIATDVSPTALDTARSNAQHLLGARAGAITFRLGDWYAALDADTVFDVIVSNPPYIAADDPHLAQGDLRFEPPNALTDHADGFAAINAIIAGAASRLSEGGWLAFEHGWTQGEGARTRLATAGFLAPVTLRDDEGRERVSLGRRPAP